MKLTVILMAVPNNRCFSAVPGLDKHWVFDWSPYLLAKRRKERINPKRENGMSVLVTASTLLSHSLRPPRRDKATLTRLATLSGPAHLSHVVYRTLLTQMRWQAVGSQL
jgi:hypothetical protein